MGEESRNFGYRPLIYGNFKKIGHVNIIHGRILRQGLGRKNTSKGVTYNKPET